MSLSTVRHRLVRAVAREESPAAQELLAVVLGARQSWTLEAWRAELATLDACTLTVGAWLESREDWL